MSQEQIEALEAKLSELKAGDAPTRCWLYKDGEGQIFEGEEAIEEAQAAGWRDTPDAVDEDQQPAVPTESNTKAEILAWLAERDIEASDVETKAQLLEKVAAASQE